MTRQESVNTRDATDDTPHGWKRLRQHWLAACALSELKSTPLSRTLLGKRLVVFRTPDGIAALQDRCPHRNAPLSAGKIIAGCVQCPYHGWRFRADGSCAFRPGVPSATAPAPDVVSYDVREHDNLVWVRLTNASEEGKPPQRPWQTSSEFDRFTWVDTVESSFVDALENLLDATHTPFVHSGLVRSENSRQAFSAIVTVSSQLAQARYVDEGRQAGWISKLFERHRQDSFGRFVPPCLAELEYTSRRGTEFVLNSCFTPETPERVRIYSTIYLRRTWVPMFAKRVVVSPFFRRVLRQDRDILRLQQQNIRACGRHFASWEGDVIRGWIETWIREGQLPEIPERRIDFEL